MSYPHTIADDGDVSDFTRVLTTRAEIRPAWTRFLQTLRANHTLSAHDWRLSPSSRPNTCPAPRARWPSARRSTAAPTMREPQGELREALTVGKRLPAPTPRPGTRSGPSRTQHTNPRTTQQKEDAMPNKAVISLTTGLEDPEKVTVAYLVAVGAAESGRPTLMFLTKEAVRLATGGTTTGVACDGCPPLPDLVKRYEAADGRYYVCPICFNAKHLDAETLIAGAELQGTIPLWHWIGDEPATTFSY